MSELMDIYNEAGQPTGETVERAGAFMQPGQYLRYVLAVVQDTHGRMLITQRSPEKHWAAGWWEITGGGVGAGETPAQTVEREVCEEVGLDVRGLTPELLYEYKNVEEGGGDNYITSIFRYTLDFTEADVHLQDTETVDYRLASWSDVCALGEQGIFLHFARLQQALHNRPIIIVRSMTIDDYDQVFALWEHIGGFALRSVDDSREGIARFLARNPTTSMVALADGAVVGSVLCGHDGRQGSLYHVCVDGAFRKHGIGRKMVESALAALEQEHISKVTLVAFTSNSIGNAFWEHLGWTPREDWNSYEQVLNPANTIRYVED